MITLKGAKTLTHFTEALLPAAAELQGDLEIIQIHASPLSLDEDLALLEYAKFSKRPRKFLIHRPDELLLRPALKSYFQDHPKERIIFLGDLIFQDPFWEFRRGHSQVIPHPYLDTSLPDPAREKFIIGTFTSWGEMRKLEHFIRLVEELIQLDKKQIFIYRIGGTLEGRALPPMNYPIEIVEKLFFPHFNVQLYHLEGKKRLGESSGSLHRGISIPVIFEANGMERIEDIRSIKIEADYELQRIDFAKAAREIWELAKEGIESSLESNQRSARANTTARFLEFALKDI